jgi:hypothetical protein
MMQAAVWLLQENKSMDATSRKGCGFSIAVRQGRNARFTLAFEISRGWMVLS